MESKEALNIIKKNKGEAFCEAYEEPLNAIQKDLERLEILEKENQELKETLNKTRKMGLEIIEENKQLSNELHKLNCYRNIELNENEKLKQALDILKDTFRIEGVYKDDGYYAIDCVETHYLLKNKEQYNLLKEVLNYEN